MLNRKKFKLSQVCFMFIFSIFASNLFLCHAISIDLVPGKSAQEPIIIDSKEDLEALAQEVNNGNSFEGVYIKLNCDINLTKNSKKEGRALKWEPIGTVFLNPYTNTISANSKPFKGIFDGNGKTICCNINKFENQNELYNCCSIFGYVDEKALIKNLSLEGKINIKNKDSNPSGICTYNFGTIENCSVNLEIQGNKNVSAIASFNYGEINLCNVNGKISSNDLDCSGISNVNYGKISNSSVKAKIENCLNGGIHNKNQFTMPQSAGIASINKGEIYGCSVESEINHLNFELNEKFKKNLSNVDSYLGNAGGISVINNGIIKNCRFDGIINACTTAGIVAKNYESIINCEACGELKGLKVAGIAIKNVVGDKKFAGSLVKDLQGGIINECVANLNIVTLENEKNYAEIALLVEKPAENFIKNCFSKIKVKFI